MPKLSMQPKTAEMTPESLFDKFIAFKKIRNLSQESINYYIKCYRYFTDYYATGLPCSGITKDVCLGYIQYLRQTRPCMNDITLELTLLLKKPDIAKCGFAEYRNWVLVNYMLGTGNRAGTIVSLKNEDVDFSSGTIILKKLKGRKQYVIPISRSLTQILQEYITYRKGEPGEPLFCTAYGKEITVDVLEKQIARYNAKRGVEKSSLHMFRHTFAKQWILNGGDIFRLQKILGHSSLEMVRRYVNMFSDDLRRDFDSFNPLDNYLGNTAREGKILMKGRK